MDLQHEVAKDLKFDWKEVPTPEDKKGKKTTRHPQGIGDNIEVIDINKKPYKIGGGDYPGVVVINFGDFGDIPGLEVISEGMCTSEAGSIAIGRQGRFMLWGFTADPDGMTEIGQQLFLNCVKYMARQKKSHTVTWECQSRELIRFRCDYVLKGKKNNDRNFEMYKNSFEKLWLRQTREELLKQKVEDYGKWFDEVYPYVSAGKSLKIVSHYENIYEIDAEARGLKTPISKMESLESWIKWSADNGDAKKAATAKTLLERYVHPDLKPKDGDWDKWLKANKERIVFCEMPGFYWLEDPRVLDKEIAGK